VATNQLPSGSQARVLRTLERCGADLLSTKRGKGSHRFVKLNGKVSTVQSGELSSGLIKTILGQLELGHQDFVREW